MARSLFLGLEDRCIYSCLPRHFQRPCCTLGEVWLTIAPILPVFTIVFQDYGHNILWTQFFLRIAIVIVIEAVIMYIFHKLYHIALFSASFKIKEQHKKSWINFSGELHQLGALQIYWTYNFQHVQSQLARAKIKVGLKQNKLPINIAPPSHIFNILFILLH